MTQDGAPDQGTTSGAGDGGRTEIEAIPPSVDALFGAPEDDDPSGALVPRLLFDRSTRTEPAAVTPEDDWFAAVAEEPPQADVPVPSGPVDPDDGEPVDGQGSEWLSSLFDAPADLGDLGDRARSDADVDGDTGVDPRWYREEEVARAIGVGPVDAPPPAAPDDSDPASDPWSQWGEAPATGYLPGEIVDEPDGSSQLTDVVELPAGMEAWDEDDPDDLSYLSGVGNRRRSARARRAGRVLAIGAGALVASVFLRANVIRTARTPTPSMEPTISEGDYFVVLPISYSLHEVRRGDVVVFDAPDGSDADLLVKRVIGLEHDIVETVDGKVFVNDRPLDEPYLDGAETDGIDRQVVPAGEVFVLGDNRSNSSDSRVFGPIDEDDIRGRAAVLLSLSHPFRAL